MSLLFSLVEVVAISRVDLSDSKNTSGGSPSMSPINWPSTSKASYLLYRDIWEGKVDKEEICILP